MVRTGGGRVWLGCIVVCWNVSIYDGSTGMDSMDDGGILC